MPAPPRTSESQLWSWLRTGAQSLKKEADVIRIENGVAVGTPDVEGCIRGGTFWCELKVAYVQRKGLKILVTPAQVRRARARCRAGGRSWILIRVCGATAHLNQHFLVDGMEAERLLEPITLADLTAISRVHTDASAVFILEMMAGQ